MRKILLQLFVFCLCVNLVNAQTVKYVKAVSKQDSRNIYFIEMLELALEKSKDKYGDYKLEGIEYEMVQSRIIREISKGKFDIVWSMTSGEREKSLLPVRIPLLKGLLGYRIFIIKKGDEYKFSQINSLKDLKKRSAGQGHDWPDTKILEANGLTVVKAAKYEMLFKMLTGDRFDYFPRGVNEPWSEVKNFEKGKLTVEKSLLIKYPAPIYFFVNKENSKLAERLEYGLNKAIDDGSFDKLFYNNESNKAIFELANIENRKIFSLDNPLLSEGTKKILDNKKYWYSVK